MNDDNVTLVLNRGEFQTLLFALGAAYALARQREQDKLAVGILDIINRVGQGDPDFLPYRKQATDGTL